MSLQSLRKRLAKPASLIEVGGFRPPEDSTISWFGAVYLGAPGEEWPHWNDDAMAPVAQLNLRDAPFLPPALEDIAMLTVFAANVSIDGDERNGEGWLVRAHPAAEAVVPLMMPPEARTALTALGCERPLKVLPIRYTLLPADFPDWPDVAGTVSVPAEIEDEWEEHFGAHEGFKLGGWPSLLQDQIFWSRSEDETVQPEYALQLGGVPKAGFGLYGDGIWYFGRGTGDARGVWTLSTQLS